MSRSSERAERGLGEVLHFFISEEEQAQARDRAGRKRAAAPAPPARWCLIAHPDRPLHAALAVELARGLAGADAAARVVALAGRSPFVPRAERVDWYVPAAPTPEALAAALEQAPQVVLVLSPDSAAALLPPLRPDLIDGVILPVDKAARGVALALSQLRQLENVCASHPVAALFVGASEPSEPLFRRLVGAARRQLGITIENLGTLERTPADFRSLLAGSAVADAEPDAASVETLARICRRLAAPAPQSP